MTQIANATAGDNGQPADRDFFITSLRSASLQYKTWAAELDMIGVALSKDLMSVETAVEWADDIGLLEYLPPVIDAEVM